MQSYQPRNVGLIAALERLRHYADITGEIYREKAYRRAMSTLRRLDYEIADDLDRFRDEKLPGIGKSIGAKIEEYIKSGKIAETRQLARDPRIRAYETFARIVGVGPATIERWYDAGIRTMNDLRGAIKKGDVVLNRMQTYGLKYARDLAQRIPRQEVTRISRDMRKILLQACRTQAEASQMLVETAGSYRRGAPDSGDIDILVSTHKFRPDYLHDVRELIETRPEYIATLSVGEQRLTFLWRPRAPKMTAEKTRVSRPVVRQVDILYMPRESYHAAILYFTGSADFNEYMRGRLKAKGYRLNQTGLYKNGELIPVSDEREIFRYADMHYVSPARR